MRDQVTKRKVLARLERIKNGNFGDYKQVSPNLFELRFFFGSGLRIYYTIHNSQVVFLLVGGDKSSQSSDIEKARRILDEME
jgi:putative addiction module killer protein